MMPLREWLFVRSTRWPTSCAMTVTERDREDLGAPGIAAMRSQKM